MNLRRTLRQAALMLAAVALMLGAFALTATAQAPTRFTVTIEGAPNGPAVLLLPGLASSQAVFDAEAKILAPTYRLYRVQIAGFAGAPAAGNANPTEANPLLPGIVAELHQYIVAQKIHPAIVSHSLGGLLALMLADQHPEDIQKLLLVDTLPYYAVVFNPHATVDTMRPQAQQIRDGMIAAPDDAFAQQSAQSIHYMVINPDAAKLIGASSLASDRVIFATAMYEDLCTDLRPRIASIKTPTTLLYPYDATVEPDAAKIDAVYTSAYVSMPNVKLHRIDASRHFVMYDQPAAFDAAVQAFLK
jgi:pimeloyl-ACP methyl ester carboxylesterase